MNDAQIFNLTAKLSAIHKELELANNLKLIELYSKFKLPYRFISDLIQDVNRTPEIKEIIRQISSD